VTEQTIKRALMTAIKTLTPEAVAIRHEDKFSAGIPDLSYSLNGRTTWWEVKYADPRLVSQGVQRHLCSRLDAASLCRYIIYQQGIAKKRPRAIRVVRPDDLDCWNVAGDEVTTGSFQPRDLVAYIARVHGVQI
jgi:hypothetical protein